MRRAILMEVGLPADIAGKIENMIKDMWRREVVDPFGRLYAPIVAIKCVLLPGPGPDYYIDLDVIIGDWDTSRHMRSMAILYNYARWVQKIVNNWGTRGPSPLVVVLWEQKKDAIAAAFL